MDVGNNHPEQASRWCCSYLLGLGLFICLNARDTFSGSRAPFLYAGRTFEGLGRFCISRFRLRQSVTLVFEDEIFQCRARSSTTRGWDIRQLGKSIDFLLWIFISTRLKIAFDRDSMKVHQIKWQKEAKELTICRLEAVQANRLRRTLRSIVRRRDLGSH